MCGGGERGGGRIWDVKLMALAFNLKSQMNENKWNLLCKVNVVNIVSKIPRAVPVSL